MRNIHAYGYRGLLMVSTRSLHAFLIAYGGKDLVTPDGKLHTDDPQVHAAAIKALSG